MKIEELPVGNSPKALNCSYFPAKHLAVIFRNWNIVPPERLAKVLKTGLAQIVRDAEAMGLVWDDSVMERFAKLGYLTIIRANWHLLDYPQLLELLDWAPDRLDAVLREEDFLWGKLGRLKPSCGEVLWRELTGPELQDVEEIRGIVENTLRELPEKEKPFAFLDGYGKMRHHEIRSGGLRLIHSYSAIYGDPFLDNNADPYPDALLSDYAASGINAVWLQGILYLLIPWLGEDMPLSKHWEKRLSGLRKLAQRTMKHGIKLYLYLNEPRALPSYIRLKQDFYGADTQFGDHQFCPWKQGMPKALANGVEHLFREVPELGGAFCITRNENPTHCLSKPWQTPEPCPICAEHSSRENIIRITHAIQDGITRAGTGARLLVWNWSWEPESQEETIVCLPKDTGFMCVSETRLETDCHGIKGKVFDYSISKPGPGTEAAKLWKISQKTGHGNIAKIQVNTTWEMSGIPAIPVPFLVQEHLDNIRKLGIKDFMLSWTLGGYPGGNLPLLDMRVEELAKQDYGPFASEILEIWKDFSEAFRLIPFHHVEQIYLSPQNVGPACPLYEKPTGYSATMVCGFPYDDLYHWRGEGHYPEDIFELAYQEASENWGKALKKLTDMGKRISSEYKAAYDELLPRSEAVYCCLKTTCNQIHFVRQRNAGQLSETRDILLDEIELAKRMLKVCRLDSRIGFEAANHYFYPRNQLLEKILNCRQILKSLG